MSFLVRNEKNVFGNLIWFFKNLHEPLLVSKINGFNLLLANKVYSLRTLWLCERIIAGYTVLLPWLKQRKKWLFCITVKSDLDIWKNMFWALFRVEGMVLEHVTHKYFCEEWMNRTVDSFITQEHNVNPL